MKHVTYKILANQNMLRDYQNEISKGRATADFIHTLLQIMEKAMSTTITKEIN